MTAALMVALGAVFALAIRQLAIAAARAIRARRRPERLEECTCGREMPISKAHIVAETFESAEERALGGMTAVSAAYCRTHCPGGCNKPKEHR